ncbi:consortin, connexin sorting protein b [Hypomesus transpacificus]|uniref:consortin, connexin sorting protein b n=1 Tax=Hypomesus transpacificus TaxID=137520 RepID=UPI001F086C4D|nr:consortin, connexin sorting protein b [Hypomesus transpacificus]
MGNKSSGPNRGTETGPALGGDGGSAEVISAGPRGGPSPELLASLQTLGEHSDHALLPQSLHQIAEAYSLEEDYPWAVQFLQLERLYHERLLSNLTALQESWESQCRESTQSLSRLSLEPNSIGQEHIDVLSKICRTHHRPTLGAHVQSMADASRKDIPNTRGQCGRREDEEEVREGAAEITSHEPDQEREEGEEGGEDEVGGDSCLILLLLCLVTVVMSLGGTAVYCALVDSCSSICTDFSHNANFYMTHARRFLDELRRWLPLRS